MSVDPLPLQVTYTPINVGDISTDYLYIHSVSDINKISITCTGNCTGTTTLEHSGIIRNIHTSPTLCDLNLTCCLHRTQRNSLCKYNQLLSDKYWGVGYKNTGDFQSIGRAHDLPVQDRLQWKRVQVWLHSRTPFTKWESESHHQILSSPSNQLLQVH
mgnify:CR=1 FL=1